MAIESLDSNPIFEIYETTRNFLRFSDFLCFLHFHFRRILFPLFTIRHLSVKK